MLDAGDLGHDQAGADLHLRVGADARGEVGRVVEALTLAARRGDQLLLRHARLLLDERGRHRDRVGPAELGDELLGEVVARLLLQVLFDLLLQRHAQRREIVGAAVLGELGVDLGEDALFHIFQGDVKDALLAAELLVHVAIREHDLDVFVGAGGHAFEGLVDLLEDLAGADLGLDFLGLVARRRRGVDLEGEGHRRGVALLRGALGIRRLQGRVLAAELHDLGVDGLFGGEDGRPRDGEALPVHDVDFGADLEAGLVGERLGGLEL